MGKTTKIQNPKSKIQNRERLALTGIVLLTFVLSVAYATASPWGEAPDETAHERYVEYVVRFVRLPPIATHPYSNEAQQPPLYYMVGASLVWGSRLFSGSEPLNGPLRANAGPAKPPVVYAVLAHSPHEQFPLYGYLLRALSILIGLISVTLVYAAARSLVPPPAPPLVALLSALIAALQPQRLFIGASATNENLAVLFSAWLCLLICRTLVATDPQPRATARRVWLIGLALGLGVLSKFTVTSFALPVAWTLWTANGGRPRRALGDLARALGLALLIAGPFLLFNTLTYGDPIAGKAVAAMLPGDSTYRLEDLYWLRDPFRWYFWSSYWGVFGWQRIWMPDWFYGIFGLLTGAGMLGVLRLLWARALDRGQIKACAALLAQAFIAYAVVVLYSLRIIAWQGREIFTALPSLCILLGLGIAGLVSVRCALGRGEDLPERRASIRRATSALALLATLAVLLIANVAALLRLHEIFDPLVK